jgi:secreted trypsin-like serine protease
MNTDATGQGGSCFGDSGSPKFVGSSSTIVAVTSWGDAVCRAHNMNWRLDIASSRAFLANFVALA